MPLCRGWQTLSHIIVINLLTGGLIEGSRVGEAGVVVFVILYYSSFIFYFDVVCEIVLFWSHLKPLRREERKETVERSDDLSWTLTSPHWCQRSLCSLSAGHSTLKVQYTHTHTCTYIHAFTVRLLHFWGLTGPDALQANVLLRVTGAQRKYIGL